MRLNCPLSAKSEHRQLCSISSFAQGRPPDGRVKTSAFAVLRLTTNSHFVTWRDLHHYGCLRTREPFIRRAFDLVATGGSIERGLWWNNPTDIWHL